MKNSDCNRGFFTFPRKVGLLRRFSFISQRCEQIVEPMEEEGERGPEEGYLLVRVHVPELNVQKCLQFPRDQLVWDVKQQCLAALPKPAYFDYAIDTGEKIETSPVGTETKARSPLNSFEQLTAMQCHDRQTYVHVCTCQLSRIRWS
ncbi:hypothetical protein Trydic_g7282 [Trypoxylus dichotomus]